jgi:hypothetical protein
MSDIKFPVVSKEVIDKVFTSQELRDILNS